MDIIEIKNLDLINEKLTLHCESGEIIKQQIRDKFLHDDHDRLEYKSRKCDGLSSKSNVYKGDYTLTLKGNTYQCNNYRNMNSFIDSKNNTVHLLCNNFIVQNNMETQIAQR